MNEKRMEQLMAYFDGEMTPEERLSFEPFLNSSPESQALLKRWAAGRRAFQPLKQDRPQDQAFVNRVMNRLEELEAPQTAAKTAVPDFLRWLFPALGYAFSAILVFLTFSVKLPLVSADTILLRQVPQETRGVYMKNASDISQMFLVEEK